MMAASSRIFFITFLLLITGGCVQTTYSGFDGREKARELTDRLVLFFIDREFYNSPPDCVTIVTASRPQPADVKRAVEQSVERHLATRFKRINSAQSARSMAARLGLNLENYEDRKVFARQNRCGSFSDIRIEEIDEEYLLLWANKSIGISLELSRADTGSVLWRARHHARRGDGGVPTSLISLPLYIFRASRIKGDTELFYSIVDDAIRRMMATLPNTRKATISSRVEPPRQVYTNQW